MTDPASDLRAFIARHDQALAQAAVDAAFPAIAQEAVNLAAPEIARQAAQAGWDACIRFYQGLGVVFPPTRAVVRPRDDGSYEITTEIVP